MWTFNLVREMAGKAGHVVMPPLSIMTDADRNRLGREAATGNHGHFYVIKTHAKIDPPPPNSMFVVTRRDIRDTLMSYMRFMDTDFEHGLAFVTTALEIERQYLSLPPDRLLTIPYPRIASGPQQLAIEIATRLHLSLDQQQIAEIVKGLTKGAVRARIEKNDRAMQKRLRHGKPLDPTQTVYVSPRLTRSFDTKTGFQTGHVSGYVEGEWQTILSGEQISRLDATIARAGGQAPIDTEGYSQ